MSSILDVVYARYFTAISRICGPESRKDTPEQTVLSSQTKPIATPSAAILLETSHHLRVAVASPQDEPSGAVQASHPSRSWEMLSGIPELLGAIFLRCLDGTEYVELRDQNSVLMTLTRVCKTWRDVALSTPDLWARISLRIATRTGKHANLYAALLKCWLARSGNRPLSLRVEVSRAMGDMMFAVVAPILPVAFRWRKLDLTAPSTVVLPVISLLGKRTPLLENINIYYADSRVWDWLAETPRLPMDLGNARRLESFSLTTPYPHEIEWDRVPERLSFLFLPGGDRLRIKDLGASSVAIRKLCLYKSLSDELLDALAVVAPCLEELQLDGCSWRTLGGLTGNPVRLSCLTSLWILGHCDSGGIANILDRICCPALVILKLKVREAGEGAGPWFQVAHFLSRSRPPLAILDISKGMPESELFAILSEIPSLTTLILNMESLTDDCIEALTLSCEEPVQSSSSEFRSSAPSSRTGLTFHGLCPRLVRMDLGAPDEFAVATASAVKALILSRCSLPDAEGRMQSAANERAAGRKELRFFKCVLHDGDDFLNDPQIAKLVQQGLELRLPAFGD